MRTTLPIVALLLAGLGAFLAHDLTLRWAELVAIAPAFVALVIVAGRRWAGPRALPALWVCAVAEATYAGIETWWRLSDGVLFWWPAGLLVIAALVFARRSRPARGAGQA